VALASHPGRRWSPRATDPQWELADDYDGDCILSK